MYQIMAIANYEDRFVIPTAHRELGEDAFDLRGSCGFSFGNGCSGGETETNLFGSPKRRQDSDGGHVMIRTFKVLSALLSYPTSDLQEAAGEMRRALDSEAIVSPAVLADLDRLIGEIADGDLFDLQERYVVLFDRTRSLSLHLFEHVHGESRDRGQAMIDLKSLYETERAGDRCNGVARLPAAVPGVPRRRGRSRKRATCSTRRRTSPSRYAPGW